jgi:hypothetical protein
MSLNQIFGQMILNILNAAVPLYRVTLVNHSLEYLITIQNDSGHAMKVINQSHRQEDGKDPKVLLLEKLRTAKKDYGEKDLFQFEDQLSTFDQLCDYVKVKLNL